jgi:hypothetical protein
MKKYEVQYANYCILFGNNRFSVIIEAENEEKAISEVSFLKREYATGEYKATEIK